jgi:catechol 2,3-dioxygenase-like lactoylglutathione lyase family enzyme
MTTTPLFTGIHHASITTRDIERLKDFYCRMFGFKVLLETSWTKGNVVADQIYGLRDTAVKMAMLRLNNVCLELFEFIQPVGKPGDPQRPVCDQGYTHICIAVSDIAAAYERLSGMGMQFNCPPQHIPGLCSATYGRDPDGNLVEVMQPAAGSPFELSAE